MFPILALRSLKLECQAKKRQSRTCLLELSPLRPFFFFSYLFFFSVLLYIGISIPIELEPWRRGQEKHNGQLEEAVWAGWDVCLLLFSLLNFPHTGKLGCHYLEMN